MIMIILQDGQFDVDYSTSLLKRCNYTKKKRVGGDQQSISYQAKDIAIQSMM